MSLQLCPSVRPSVRKNTVILPVYAGPVKSRWSFASSNKNTFHTVRALQPGLQLEVYPLSTATTPSSQLARTCAGVSIGLQNCANAMVPGGPVRSKLAPKPAHPLVHFPRVRGLIRGAPHCFPLSWKLKPVHFLVGEVKDLESCKEIIFGC